MITAITAAAIVLMGVSTLILGLGIMIACNERIPGVNEPGYMPKENSK